MTIYGKSSGISEGREDYRIHSRGLGSHSPEKLRDKVDKFLEKKVQEGDLIDVDYYIWFVSWDDKPHRVRITYYLPKVKK
jgi:hypothetical protein